jgi:hypothetical protein
MDIGFKYYLVVFLTVFLISIGILLLKNPFFMFANATAHLLNSMLESSKDESLKQKHLIHSLGDLLPKFGLLLLIIALTIGVSFIPVVVYLEYNPQKTFQDLDMRSIYFFISVVLGSIALFIVPLANRNKDSDYSGWSILLHRMILENYNISTALFRLEKKLYKKKTAVPDKDFVIVTGLARAGTTALTNLLFETKRFHLLSYNNMPFLLSVNLWRKLYRPRKDKLKQRAHGDNLMFGYRTIEALEEYFFKVFLKDSYISYETLEEHELDERVYSEYRNYQKLICPKNQDSNYLAKNNNLILRYKSLRSYNPDFKIVMVFRSPLSHAYSLLTQHNRFCDMHEADPFSLEYMNWLGHHEFGSNHKMFNLDLIDLCKRYDSFSINYWISIWISYYTHILTLLEDPNLFLIDYSDLCSKPTQLLSTLGGLLHLDLPAEEKKSYSQREVADLEPDEDLLKRARSIHEQLKKHKLNIS